MPMSVDLRAASGLARRVGNCIRTERDHGGGRIANDREGPVAWQETIKELGTNGGGFMNANSAHPYENPTPLTNLIQILAIFSIGVAGLTHTFGKMVGDRRQGWALFAVMAILFIGGATTAIWAEQQGNLQFQKTPNEIALSILLSGLTIVFLLVVVTLYPFGLYGGTRLALPVLVALLVCLIPTTIGGLLSAIGIAGMDRLVQHNVLAMSGRSVEAAGDVDTLLLDKTGTITLGNRMAAEFLPVQGVEKRELAEAAQLASLADETPEGRSIVVLAKREYNLRGRELGEVGATFIPFSAQTRMSGVDIGGHRIRKGAADQIMHNRR